MNKKLGFTLVEVLVAVVILVVVIGGVTALESGNIKTGTSGKFNIQANGLAQEGANIVKSLDDNTNKLGNSNSGDCSNPSDLTNCSAGVYYINPSNQLIKCKDSSDNDVNKTDPTAIASCVVPDTNTNKANGQTFTRKVVIP
jgi:prepilin-type N-terminal cleavage/methylation domain-containing protein